MFLETCVTLCCLDKDSILKTILREKFEYIQNVQNAGEDQDFAEDLPEGLGVLVHNPSPENFVEYAFALCSLRESKEVITRHLLSLHFDDAIQLAVKSCTGPRVRTRQSKVDSDQLKKRMRRIELPKKLSVFTDGSKTLVTMCDIISNFFPGLVQLVHGVYKNNSVIVLFVVDTVRCCWRSAGVKNKLTWYTTLEDVDRKVFDVVTSNDIVLHVVRNRNSEMRYMGKCEKFEEVQRVEGCCTMYVG